MSTLRANTITNGAGSGAPDFPNGVSVGGSPVSALASQAEAEAGTNNTNIMTPLRAAQAIAALSGLQNVDVRTSTGGFTIPAGVTKLYVVAAGGGGGGADGYNSSGRNPTLRSGGDGGPGGLAASYLTGQTPGGTISYTIGAGGAGSNAGNGSAGGTTTTGAISCTGGGGGTAATAGVDGANGANGVGSGGNISNNFLFANLWPILPLGNSLVDDAGVFITQASIRPGRASLTAAIAYSGSGTNQPGAGGSGEIAETNTASGGVGGCVIFVY